uniref:SH3 domain-binding protein 5 n=1 Tax=Astyanax mexicanus TaxID=7994 RepID=A0A3B1KA63_ASTMX
INKEIHFSQFSQELKNHKTYIQNSFFDEFLGYRILTDSARKLNAQGSQLGDCIQKAWPYYEALREAEEVSRDQKAALRYERAVFIHTAAREMVCVAEQCLLADRNTMDPTWQEMLNHATAKVNKAQAERLRSERERQWVTQLCQEAKARVQTLQKALMRVILKSKPYFELKSQFIDILEEQKSKVVKLEVRVAEVKTRFGVTLCNLEQISEQIHAQRERFRAARKRNRARGGRSSPVGAESEDNWAENEAVVGEAQGAGLGSERRGERAGLDSMSVISLQNIDLEKCDSVEHLCDLSDVGSLVGEEKETEGESGVRAEVKVVVREVANIARQEKEAERGASAALNSTTGVLASENCIDDTLKQGCAEGQQSCRD